MSFDAQIAHACPHHIRYELVSISGGREIITESPISGVGLFELRVDGRIVPSEGEVQNPEWVIPQTAPYRIKSGENLLSFYEDHDLVVSLEIPPKIYTQGEFLRYLRGVLPVGLEVSERGKTIAVVSREGTSLKVSGGVLGTFGMSVSSYVSKRRELFPSWKLVKRAGSRGYKVLLGSSISTESILDISYTAEKSYCRRCNGTGVENDILFDEYGKMRVVGGYDLLYQKVAKCLLTELGSNQYHSFYGSTAMGLIGKKVSAGVVVALRGSVQNALDVLIDLQNQQAKVQAMSLEERVKRVRSVEVSTIGNDETSYLVRVSVESFSSQPVSVNIVFAVPGAISLDGELS